MALEKQIVELSVTSGLMQIADRRFMPAGHWLRLENAISAFGGSVQKRDGYDALPNAYVEGGTVVVGGGPNGTGTMPANVVHLTARGDELIAYAVETDINDTLSFSWAPAQDRWIRQDDGATTSHTIAQASNIYGFQNETQIVRCESVAGGVAYVQSFVQGAGNALVPPGNVYVSAHDAETGADLIAETLTESLSVVSSFFEDERTMTFPPLLGVDGYAGIVTLHKATNEFFWTRVDPFGAAIAAPVVFFVPGNPVTAWDVHELGDNRFALVHGDTVTSNASLTTWDATPAVPVLDQINLFPIPFAAGFPNCIADISVYGIAGSVVVVGWRVTNAAAVVEVELASFTDAAGLPNVYVTTVETPSATVIGRPHYVSVSCHASGYGVITWDRARVAPGPVLGAFGAIGVSFLTALGVVFSAGAMVNCEALSRPTQFGDGGWYCQAVTVSHATIRVVSSVLLRLDHTLGITPTLVGILYRQATSADYSGNFVNYQPVDISVDGKSAVVLGTQVLSLAVGAVLAQDNITTRVLQVTLSCEQIQAALRQSYAVSLCLANTGSMVGWYDGGEEVELSYAHAPTIEIDGVPPVGPPNTFPSAPAPQQWLWRAVYEWWDEEGNLHQSAPSDIVSFVPALPVASITFRVQTIGATRKGRPEHGGGRPIQIAIFRTTANGSQFFRLYPQQQGIPNDLAFDSVTFTDATDDATLQKNAYGFLYTDGGALPNTTISGALSAVVHANRLWIADPMDPQSVLYSKLLVQGEAPGFNAGVQRLRLDDEEESITALASLDDKLLIFTDSSMFYVSGPGPNDTGNPPDSFLGPVRVQVDAGCNNARSILQDGDGVIYQAPKGLYRVDRNLSAEEIPEVRAAMLNATVLTTQQDVATQKSRILLSRSFDFLEFPVTEYLIHDFSPLDLWTTQTDWVHLSDPPSDLRGAALASTYWQGKHVHFVAPDPRVRVQGKSGLDDGAWIPLTIETPWIHVGGVAGYQRVWRATMLGRKMSNHDLTMNVFCNYNETVPADAPTTWDVGSGSPVVGLPLQALTHHVQHQICTAIKLQLVDSRHGLQVPTDGASGFDLVALRFEIGTKPGSIRLPIQNRG